MFFLLEVCLEKKEKLNLGWQHYHKTIKKSIWERGHVNFFLTLSKRILCKGGSQGEHLLKIAQPMRIFVSPGDP